MNTQAHKILMVDDEPNILSGYQRTVGRNFSLTCAEGGEPALIAIAKAKSPFSVIITDMRMPRMNGIEFITAAKLKTRDSVFMVLTGNADQQTAVDAINNGQIFRFLNKPCTCALLETSILAAIRQYELVTAERVLLRDTFAGSVRLLIDTLELANPTVFRFQSLVKATQQQACRALGIGNEWELAVAGSLCLIGLVAIPGIKPNEAISEKFLETAAVAGSQLVSHIPRLASVSTMIRRQREPGLLPASADTGNAATLETIGARLLRFAVDLAIEHNRRGNRADALKQLASLDKYDPRLIRAVLEDNTVPSSARSIVQEMAVTEIQPGMMIEDEVRDPCGAILLSKGQVISELSKTYLRQASTDGSIPKTLKVRVDSKPDSAAA